MRLPEGGDLGQGLACPYRGPHQYGIYSRKIILGEGFDVIPKQSARACELTTSRLISL